MRQPINELSMFLNAFPPDVIELFHATREVVLASAPEANELIYDGYNALSCAYSFSDKLAQAFIHIAVYGAYVNLGFNQGASLNNPERVLKGKGKAIRHARIEKPSDLNGKVIENLVLAAIQQGEEMAGGRGEFGRSSVKSVSAKKKRPL